MNVKTTIALVVLLIAVGAYFFFVEMNAPDPESLGGNDAPSIRGEPLFPDDFPSPGEGASLTIERDGQVTTYRHLSDQWFQTKPVRVAMNNGSMEDLAGDVIQLRYTQRLKPGASDALTLEEARLDPPLATITYAMDDDSAVLRLGKKLMGGYGYAAVGDNPTIHVVADRLHSHVLDADPNQWRRRTLEPPPASQIDQITVRGANEAFSLHRGDDGWLVDASPRQHADGRADTAAVEALAAGLEAVVIERFHADAPDDLSLYGLDQPEWIIAWRDAATQEESALRVGGPTDLSRESVFAVWSPDDVDTSPASPVVFSIPRASLQPFEVDIDALRDPRLFGLDASETRAITVEREGMPTLALERDTSGPKFADPDPGYDADLGAATGLIDDVTGMAVESFVPGFEPTSEPIARVDLLRRGTGGESASIYRDDDRYVALRDGEKVGYVLTDEQVELLRTPRLALRDREVFDIPAEAITKLTLAVHGEKQAFVRDGERFVLEGGGEVDQGRVGALVAALHPLYAERWSLPSDSLFSAAAPVTLEIETATGTVTLAVDPDSGVGVLDNDSSTPPDIAFWLPRATVDLLTGGLSGQSLLSVEPEAIESIRIEQGGDFFTLRRESDGTIIADKAEHLPTIDQAMATKLFDAIAGLEVDRAFDASAVERAEDTMVLVLTVAAAGDQPRMLELWTQDGRMFTAGWDGPGVLAVTEDSARELAFLFAPPPSEALP